MAKQYQKRLHKNSAYVKSARQLLKSLNIRYRFNLRKGKIGYFGLAMPDKNLIQTFGRKAQDGWITESGRIKWTWRQVTVQEWVSTVFHEIQHIRAYRKGKYPHYHRGFRVGDSKQKFERWAAEYLKAEQWCDKQAARMLKKYHPEIPYLSSYFTPIVIESVKSEIAEYRTSYL